MNKKQIIVLAIILAIVCALNLFALLYKEETNYEYEQITVSAGDTFWEYWEEGYYGDVNYFEALYTFKKDNNMDKYSLQAGDKIVLRKVVE